MCTIVAIKEKFCELDEEYWRGPFGFGRIWAAVWQNLNIS
jgi:hypothetical protein